MRYSLLSYFERQWLSLKLKFYCCFRDGSDGSGNIADHSVPTDTSARN